MGLKTTCSIIGFFGSEKYEIITYFSRILYNLKKRVLIIDFSDMQALTLGLSQVENLAEMESKVVEFQGVDYYINNLYENNPSYKKSQMLSILNQLEKLKNEYEIILIDFGFTSRNELTSKCTQIFYITDLQKYNTHRLKNCLLRDISNAVLIIKEVSQCKITSTYLIKEFKALAPIEKTYVTNLDIIDHRYKIVNPYCGKIYFQKLSRNFRIILLEMVVIILPDLNYSLIKHAYRRAKRGE